MADVNELLQRHAAFWHHERQGEPLMCLRAMRYGQTFDNQDVRYRRPFENQDVTPDILDVEALTPEVGTRDWRKSLVQGDLFHGEFAFSRIPWMEAIVGCEIHSGTDEAMWARPALGPSFEGIERIVPTDDNPWLKRLLALTQALVDANDGSYLVTPTLLRGPSDILSALLGDERMGLAFFDAPDRVDEVLARATEAFIKVARAQLAVIPAFRGGWACWLYGLWAPGSMMRFQSDSSSQLSPAMYRERILPHDREIMRAFEYSIIDLHSAGTLHLHRALMEIPELDAISVTMDRYANAPGLDELLPTFAAILEAKSLSVFGEMTMAEVERLRQALPTASLCVNASVTEKLLFERPV
jgi:hypothetical protein